MSFTTRVFTASTPQALEAQVNAFLTPFVGSNAKAIRRLEFFYSDRQRFARHELMIAISYQNAWVSVPSQPYQIKIFSNRRPTPLENAVNAFISANPSYFFGGVRFQRGYLEEGRLPSFFAVVPYSADGNAWQSWSMQ